MSRADVPEEDRRAAFAALVEAQDGGMTPRDSRAEACRRFGLSDGQLRRIEEEGLAKQWPPLS
jgi:hypothetical protein